MTAEYSDTKQTFAAAESRLELAADILAGAKPAVEGDVGWVYATKTRRLPSAAVRAALPELKIVDPLIPGRDASDYGVMSLLRDADGEVVAFQLVFVDCHGAASTKGLKRQTYNLRAGGVSSGLFHAGGGEGDRCFVTEGYLEKPIALASLGIGKVYGGGGRGILGTAPPPESELVLVIDRTPDDKVVDLQTKLTAADAHARDMKRAVDLLLLAGKTVSLTPDPTCSCCKDVDAFLAKHGPVRLQDWIEQAEPVGDLSLDGHARRISRIADPLERDAETTATAKRLKVRVGEFREAVRKHHDGEADRVPAADKASGSAMTFPEVVAAADRQDGAQLLDDLDAAIARHAFITRTDRTKALLWSVHNHRRFLNNVSVLPRLVITAPGEDSGKSTLAATLVHVGDAMEHTTDPTPAVIFRSIEAYRCGLMLDEVDGWWRRDEGMRSILNSGFTLEGAHVSRVEDVGGGLKRVLAPRRYSTFSPIAAVGIKLDTLLPRTLISRSLLIRMTPARVGEVPEEIFGNRAAVARLHTLASRIKRWIADNETALCIADPEMPKGLINRIRLVWRPLFVIANQAGGQWPQRVRDALEADRGAARDPSLGEQLLVDLRDVILGHGFRVGTDRAIHTLDAITHLVALEERTWGCYGRARDAIRDFEVSKLLAPYGLAPKQIQKGGRGGPNRNGYRLVDVEAAIVRFIRPTSLEASRRLDVASEDLEGADELDFPSSAEGLVGPEAGVSPLDGETLHSGLGSRLGSGQEGISAPDQWSRGLEAVGSLGVKSNTQDHDGDRPGGCGDTPPVTIGSRIQWTSEDVDQFPGGATVAWVSDDGEYVRVDGSMTGIPISQVTVLYAPAGGSCIECGDGVPKPARGPTPKRCPKCRAKRKRPKVEPGVVFT